MMYTISERDPKVARAARLLIDGIHRSIGRYQDKHDGQKPAAIMLSSDAVTVLWLAAASPDELLCLMEHQCLKFEGVPLYRYTGAGQNFYLAEAIK